MVIGGFMMFWLRGHRSGKSTAAEGNAEDKVRIASKFTAPTEDQALDLVKRALANRDPGELDSLFHLGGSSPAEVIEFIAGAEASDGRVERYSWLSSMDVEGLQMEGVVVAYAGKETTSERLAFLTPTDEGVWKVDFEAFARTSRPPWKDLLEGRAERAQVRVFIAKDEYYNGPFADDSRWVCFGMASLESNALLPEGREMLRGYCEIGSAQAKAMEQLFAGGVRMHRATLELSRPKDADSRQFVISRVLGEDWVVTSKRYDERFK
jgi:hypothetical protein